MCLQSSQKIFIQEFVNHISDNEELLAKIEKNFGNTKTFTKKIFINDNECLKLFIEIFESKKYSQTQKLLLNNFNNIFVINDESKFDNDLVKKIQNFFLKKIKNAQFKNIFLNFGFNYGKFALQNTICKKNKNIYFYICTLWLISQQNLPELFIVLQEDYKQIKLDKEALKNYKIKLTCIYDDLNDYKLVFFNVLINLEEEIFIDFKWNFLIKTCNFYEKNVFLKDLKFCKKETADLIFDSMRKSNDLSFQNIVIDDKTTLIMIADILENKEKIVAQFINAHSYKSIELDFDILKILQNFKYLNKKCNFDKINKILKYSIKNHDLKSLNILDFFEGLSFKAKIVRCRLLDLDYSKIIDVNEISENLVHYVNKLPKSYFDYNKEKFKDCEDILFQIYPDLSSQSNILKIIENSKNAAKILPKINDIETIGKIETVILSKYVVSDYIYVLTNTKLPEQLLPLFLFSTYKHKKIISEKIKAKYLIEKYFDEGFITYILKSKLVCIFDFVNSIHVKIKDSNIKNCIFFQDEFYYLNSIFYENFENVQMSIENYNFFHNILNILNTDGILSNCNTEEKFSINFLKSVLIEILCLEIPKFLDFDINDRIYTILDISNPYFCFKILLDHYFKNKKKFEIIYMYYKKFIVKNKNFKLEIFKIIQGDHKNLSYLYKNKFQKNLKFCEENFISYASIYLITKKGRKYDDSYYKFYQKVSNKRVKDLLLEYLIKICDVHYSIKHVDEHLKVSKTIINKFRHSANSINICIESLMDISDKSLSYLLKLDFFEKINHFMIIKYIENNTNIIHPIYNKRQQIFEIFYDKISIAIAAKIEQKYKNLINLNNLNDKEKFNDLCENFFGEKYSIGNINEIYTILFLKSLSNIKNSEILRFFEIQLDQSEIKEKFYLFQIKIIKNY